MKFKGKQFLYTIYGVLILFLGMISLNVWAAYSRRSGSTGLDMAKIKEMRKSFSKQIEMAEKP